MAEQTESTQTQTASFAMGPTSTESCDLRYELDRPRWFTFTFKKDRGRRRYNYVLRRIPVASWEKLLDAIASGGCDLQSAWGTLVRENVINAEGYAPHFTHHANWPQRLPDEHVFAVATILQQVVAHTEPAPLPGSRRVVLQATWGAPGAGILLFQNLVHIFREPSSEHERRHQLSRMTETAAARGGSPTGALLFLYDELIEAVEGYSVAGAPVPAQRIAAEMDAMHKLVALERLFNPSDARLVARDGEWFASRFLRQCRSGRR